MIQKLVAKIYPCQSVATGATNRAQVSPPTNLKSLTNPLLKFRKSIHVVLTTIRNSVTLPLLVLFDTNSLPSMLSTFFHTSVSASNFRVSQDTAIHESSVILHRKSRNPIHRCTSVQMIEGIVPSTWSEIE